MKTVMGLVLSLALVGAAAAQPAGPALHRMAMPPPTPMTGKAVSVPIAFTAGMPTIEITVNGKGPFHVGFDTGAMGGVHIADAAAAQAGLEPVGEGLATDPSGRNPQRIKVYGQAEVGLGGRSFTSFTTGAPPMLAGSKLAGLDGVAGLGLFGGALVTIDYGKATLTVEPGALPEPDGRTIFAYEGPLPVLKLSVEGRTLDAHLDTGNVRAPVIVTEDFAQGLAAKAAATPAGVAHTVSSEIPMFAVKLASAPKVGEVTLAVGEAQYPSVAPIGNVGSLALTGMIVRVDTLHRRVQVIAPPKATRAG
jgi:hypothetical protein